MEVLPQMLHRGRDMLLNTIGCDTQFRCHLAIRTVVVVALLQHQSRAGRQQLYLMFYLADAFLALQPFLIGLGSQLPQCLISNPVGVFLLTDRKASPTTSRLSSS